MNITCSYPTHPQNSATPGWNNGVLGIASQPVPMWCPGCAVVDAANPPATTTNAATLAAQAVAAIAANRTYLAIGTPTNTQVAAQVRALTQECSGLIRLLLGQLDATS